MSVLKSLWASIVRTWQGSKGGKIGLGCVALIFVCVICTVCTSAYGMTPQVQEISRATVQAVALATAVQATEQAKPTNTYAPTDTPGPTDTPAPTNTPGPTDTTAPPTETPLPTNTRSPQDRLRDKAIAQFGSEMIGVQVADVSGINYATVDYDLGLQWDEGTAVLSAQHDFMEFAPEVFEIGAVDALELRAFTEFKDALGNTQREVAIKFTLQRALAERINWDGIERRTLGIALNSADGNGVYVHPALRAAWNDSQD